MMSNFTETIQISIKILFNSNSVIYALFLRKVVSAKENQEAFIREPPQMNLYIH